MSKIILSKSSFPPICGDGARIYHIATRFTDKPLIVSYKSPFGDPIVNEDNNSNVTLKKIGLGYSNLFKENEALKSSLEKNSVLIIYAMQPDLLFAIHTINKAKKEGLKIVIDVEDMPTYANNFPYKFFNFYIKKRYNELLRSADKIICISEYLKRELISDFNIEGEKIDVIHNGVDMSFFKRDEAAKESLRKQYGVTEDDVVFIYSGAIVDWSGAISCLDSFKKVIQENPNIKVFFIGNGDIEQLQNKIKELKLEKNAKYLGYFPFEKMPELLSVGDVGLLPFKKDPLTEAASPIKIFEYMSMGMPVISTDVMGTKEVIKDSYNGILVKDDGELVSAITKISEDKDFYKKLKEKSFETVKMYDWTFLAKRFEEILDN
ncbi:MAG: glycosyltransferase family 4 protein [Methanobacterium sp.]